MSKPGEQIYVHEKLDSVEGDATEYIRGDIVEAIRQQVRDGENARTELEAEVKRLQEKCFNDVMAAKKSGYEDGRAEVERLQKGIDAVSALIANSAGVDGLHLNGDVARWGELLAGGRDEIWLCAFSEAAKAAEGK